MLPRKVLEVGVIGVFIELGELFLEKGPNVEFWVGKEEELGLYLLKTCFIKLGEALEGVDYIKL